MMRPRRCGAGGFDGDLGEPVLIEPQRAPYSTPTSIMWATLAQ